MVLVFGTAYSMAQFMLGLAMDTETHGLADHVVMTRHPRAQQRVDVADIENQELS